MIRDTLTRVCELQCEYSSKNTEAMAERGRLIRQTLPADIQTFQGVLRDALGEFADEMDIEGSDGIGRKTEAPWVRIFNKTLSPSATGGFYAVIHFKRNGGGIYVTVGCGSTTWTGGDLVPISDSDLARKTDWAKQVTQSEFGSLAPFDDQIDLGATANLPRQFEKATAFARFLSVAELTDSVVQELLVAAVMRLRNIYKMQDTGGDVSPLEDAEATIAVLTRPIRSKTSGQGFRLSQKQRSAIEHRAMTLATEWLEASGYGVIDKSKNSSYDLEASRGGETLKVEVKGTTSSGIDGVIMTRNEVELHRQEKGGTALVIVSQISLTGKSEDPVATGGTVWADIGWDIDGWLLEPLAYKVVRKP